MNPDDARGWWRGMGGTITSVLALAVVVWLLYLAVKVAQHVQAWPF